MLQWNELRITPDGKFLIVDVEVQNLSYYEDVYLESLKRRVFSDPKEFTPIPDQKAVVIWSSDIELNNKEDNTPSEDIQLMALNDHDQIQMKQKVKHLRQIIDIDTIGDNLIFLYAEAYGEPTADTPCGAKEPLLLGVVYNKALLYKNSLSALSTLEDCTPSKDLIDYIFTITGFKLALEVGDYSAAITSWNNIFKKKLSTSTKKCGCHGH